MLDCVQKDTFARKEHQLQSHVHPDIMLIKRAWLIVILVHQDIFAQEIALPLKITLAHQVQNLFCTLS